METFLIIFVGIFTLVFIVGYINIAIFEGYSFYVELLETKQHYKVVKEWMLFLERYKEFSFNNEINKFIGYFNDVINVIKNTFKDIIDYIDKQ